MVCYVVLLEDRHSDTNVYLFYNEEKAIEEARRIAKENSRNGEIEEEAISIADGWRYIARYSCEGDHTRVLKRTISEVI